MNRRSLVRLQLIVLGILVLGLIARRMWMNVGFGGTIAIEDVSPFELHRLSFRVDAPTPVDLRATGSLDTNDPQDRMAAGAWIIRRGEYEPVWELRPQDPASTRGTLVRASQRVVLAPGTYDAFFASFGHDLRATAGSGFFFRLFHRDQEWEKDSRHWGLSIQPAEKDASITPVDAPPSDAGSAEGVVWHFSADHSRSSDRTVFEVTNPLDVRVQAVGEIGPTGRDYGWIDNLTERRRIWELALENSVPAGGGDLNRRADARVHLASGVYAAGFETDDTHAPDYWRVNPPYNPDSWGMIISTDSLSLAAVQPFDPWESRTPLLELTRIGSDQHDQVRFTVEQPLDVVVEALGEISSSEQYDYGWIESASGERVWEMRHANTTFAGGDRYNREALEIIRLSPGSYSAHFETDDSHAFGDWQKRQPRKPERWGITLFPLNRDMPETAFSVQDRTTSVPTPPSPPMAVPSLPNFPDLPQLRDLPSIDDLRRHLAVQISGVGNGANLRESFRVDSTRSVIVVAQGEILPTERYDYAWIERADNGESVWSMTWDNTLPAGGDDRNRLFAGSIELPAGDYVVRYQSDPSHAFGDFGKIAPENPESWGVSVIVPDP